MPTINNHATRYVSSRYNSTGRMDRTLSQYGLVTRHESLYRRQGAINAPRTILQQQSRGDRLASELRQFEAEELDLTDLLDTINELGGSSWSSSLSPRLLAAIENADARQCSDCQNWTIDDELYGIDDNSGDRVCDSCRCDNCCSCDSCGNTIRNDNITYVNDSSYCESCYDENFTTCDRCSESIANDDVYTVEDRNYCQSCCEDHATYCESQGEYRLSPCDDCDCESCHGEDCECRHCSLIYDYSTTLCRALGTLPENRIKRHVMGAELECEVSDKQDFAKSLRNQYPATSCHCKRDGSLDSTTGVEIVTGHGIQSELLSVLEFAANLARREYDGQSHNGDSCGLHIGLDRSQFSSALQARIIVFWNSGENYPLLRQFTRRDYRNLSYCSIKPEKASDAFIARPDLSSREKYEIVNTRHASHLEFRGFRGSLLPRTLRACVSLVSLIASYCEIATTAAELTSGRFIDWLLAEVADDDCRKQFVIAYLVNRGKQLEQFAARLVP